MYPASIPPPLESSSGSLLSSKSLTRSAPIFPFTKGSESMLTGAQRSSSQNFLARKANPRPPRKCAPADSRRPPKLMDRLQGALRSSHYSQRTEQAYCHWVKRFIYFHNVRYPAEMAEPEINACRTHLAVKEKVSASTQNETLPRFCPFSGLCLPFCIECIMVI
jgi:hypothetical protein